MVMRSTLISALRSAFRAAVLAAACAYAAPVLAQANDKMTPIAIPDQPTAIEIGTGPLPDAKAQESWHTQYGSKFARNVTVATITPFLPDPAKASGAAVVVAPGRRFPHPVDGERRLERRPRAGRAGRRGIRPQVPAEPDPGGHGRIRTLDGRDVLGHRGAASAPRSAGDDGRLAPQIADARAAFALIRRRAAEWKIDPDRIGMVGFSAGAMLTMATALAGEDAKPAFIGNIYGPLAAVSVPADAPPLFAALAADDPFFANGGFGLIDSWRAAKKPAEFHLYEQGGHGFGMYPKETTSTGWFDAFVSWLDHARDAQAQGLIACRRPNPSRMIGACASGLRRRRRS